MPVTDSRSDVLVDPVWSSMRRDAALWAAEEPALAGWLHTGILDRKSFEDALVFRLSQKLGGPEIPALSLYHVLHETVSGDHWIEEASRTDLSATYERDPACTSFLEPFIFFKGYQALQAHRIAHRFWSRGRRSLALHVQSRTSEVFNVDIHPAAVIGKGIMIDHAFGVVVGETAAIGDGVSLLHGVTLGGLARNAATVIPRSDPAR